MLVYLMIWAAVGIALTRIAARRRNATAGLPLAYFICLSLTHVPGAMVDLAGASPTPPPGAELYLWGEVSQLTLIGFQHTVYGLVAFLGGVVIAYALGANYRRRSHANVVNGQLDPSQLVALDRAALLCIVIGTISYFVLLPLLGNLPTVNAVIASLGSLMVVGLCLRLWLARQNSRRVQFWSTVALLPLLILSAVVQTGFLSFGTTWVVIVASFLFTQSRRKWTFYVFTPVIFFIGLSLFVNYMSVRNEIRGVVWSKQSSMSDRLIRVMSLFSEFHWLDLSDRRQAQEIDDRLNQNFLDGLAVERLDAGEVSFSYGASFGAILLGLIPRAVWPDKPQVGGGGTIVSDVTGLKFVEGISVGAGQVLEFYANFGMFGLVVGFALWGCLLGYLDRRVAACLYQGDQAGFVLWFLIAAPLMHAEGNLLEIAVSAAAAVPAALGLSRFMNWHVRVRQLRPTRLSIPSKILSKSPRNIHHRHEIR